MKRLVITFLSSSFSCLTDVDECEEQSSCCEQDCSNYPGGYECYCSAGYRLNSDGCSCDGTQYTFLLNLGEFQLENTQRAHNAAFVLVEPAAQAPFV